jgi:hypothetical protein
MTVATKDSPTWPDGSHRSLQIVTFQETLWGFVRMVDLDSPLGDDRLECSIASESVMTADSADRLRACHLENLKIAVDVGVETADGGLAGVVRSGRVVVEGAAPLAVEYGEFELFPRVAGDARRMRYRLWLRDTSGANWFLRGTKLVVNEIGLGLVRRIWVETTTLYVVIVPLHGGPVERDDPQGEASAGVVQVRLTDFIRQLGSLHGEPGPVGGIRAVRRLVSTFWSVIAEVYLRRKSTAAFPPGIEAAFSDPEHPGRP